MGAKWSKRSARSKAPINQQRIGQKTAKAQTAVEPWVLNHIANEKRQKEGNRISFRMAISKKWSIVFYSAICKYMFLWKNQHIKKKQEGMSDIFTNSSHAKFQALVSVFDVFIAKCLRVHCGVTFSIFHISSLLNIGRQNKRHHWASGAKLA